MTGLVEWLTAAFNAGEVDCDWHTDHCVTSRVRGYAEDCDCGGPERALAIVQAHREILDAYQDQQRRSEENSAKFVRLMRAPTHVKDDEGLTGVKTHGWELKGRLDALHHSVQVLAGIYRESFPGFDPSWIGES